MDDTTNERLVRIETKLDMLISQEADKEARLRALEAARWWVLGAAGVLSCVAPLVAKKLFGI